MKALLTFSLAVTTLVAAPAAQALDAAAAEALVRKSKCMTCHAIDKKKDGPAYKEIATKYKGKADAVAKITKHITEPSTVKVEGKEEEHELIRSKDPAEIRNVVDWLMSL